jgi:hypothetical protein
LLQDVEIGLQVRRIDCADNGRVQIRIRDGKTENELDRGHALEQIVELGPLPAFPLPPYLFPFGWSSFCRPAANDDTSTTPSSCSDCLLVFALDCRIGNLKDIENPHRDVAR